MTDDDIVIIEAPDDEDELVAAAGTPPGAVSDAPADGIAELRKQLAESEAAGQRKDAALLASETSRREADQRAAAAAGQAREASVAVQSAELDSIVNALAVSESEIATAQREYSAAMAEGDFDKAGALQVKISKATARQVQLEDGKTELERRREAAAAAPPQQVQVPATISAQQEAYIAQQPPRVAAWMRANPRFFTDKDFSARAMKAHHKALGDGIDAGSDEYFRRIDQEANGAPTVIVPGAQVAGGRVVDSGAAALADQRTQAAAAAAATQQPEMGRVASSASAPAARTPAAAPPAGRVASAAPSRDAVNGVTARGGQMTVALTKEQRQFAIDTADENDPDPVKTYARNLIRMKQMGKTF